jgi:hypothetical protein
MWFFLIAVFSKAMIATSFDERGCDIEFERSPRRGFVPRVVAAPDVNGVSIVSQDGDRIELRRFTHNCAPVGGVLEVNSTENFWSSPGESGLADAVWLCMNGQLQDRHCIDHSKTAIAWTLDGDVWVRIVSRNLTLGPIIRVNDVDPRWHRRDQVQLTPVPDGSGFVIAWSSWMQDGDGWGVFARRFDVDESLNATASGKEQVVNQEWHHFQWRPQLTWCGNSLWALWENGTGSSCNSNQGSDCSTGPYLRRLVASSEPWGALNEKEDRMNYGGGTVLASAVACLPASPGSPSDVSDDATVMWLHGNMRVEVNRTKVKPNASLLDNTLDFRRRLADMSWGASLMASFSYSMMRFRNFLGRDSTQALGASLSTTGVGGFWDNAGSGKIALVAKGNILVVVSLSDIDSLYVQLLELDYISPLDLWRGLAHPRRQLASGSQAVRAVMGPDQQDRFGRRMYPDLFLCWVSGGTTETDQLSAFSCTRRPVLWMENDGKLELGGKLAIIIMLFFICIFCRMRHYNNVGRRGLGNRRRCAIKHRCQCQQTCDRCLVHFTDPHAS